MRNRLHRAPIGWILGRCRSRNMQTGPFAVSSVFGVDGDRTRTGVCFSSFSRLGGGRTCLERMHPSNSHEAASAAFFCPFFLFFPFLLFSSLHLAIFHALVTLIAATRAPSSCIPAQKCTHQDTPWKSSARERSV